MSVHLRLCRSFFFPFVHISLFGGTYFTVKDLHQQRPRIKTPIVLCSFENQQLDNKNVRDFHIYHFLSNWLNTIWALEWTNKESITDFYCDFKMSTYALLSNKKKRMKFVFWHFFGKLSILIRKSIQFYIEKYCFTRVHTHTYKYKTIKLDDER